MVAEAISSVLQEVTDSGVPSGWRKLSLGEIGEFSTSSVNKKEEPGEAEIRLVNYMDVYRHCFIDDRLDLMTVTARQSQIIRSQVEVGDILFTPSSETPDDIGHSAVVFRELPRTLHSYHTVRLRPSVNGLLDLGFSGWFASSPAVLRQFARRSTGSTRFTLSLADFREVEVVLPPLPEQRKIAAILSSVDDAIAAVRQIIEQTEQVKQGLLQTLMTRGIGRTQFKQTEIGEIPEQWELVQLEDACSKIGVGIASAATHAYTDEGVPLIRNQNIRNGELDLDDLLFVTEEYADANRSKRLCAGDVVTMRTGEPGRSAVIPPPLDGAQTFTTLIFRPGPGLLGSYLSAFLNSRRGRRQVEAYQAGGAQANLNVRVAKQIRIPIPPIAEQEGIVEIGSSADSSLFAARNQIQHLQTLKRGLLRDLLTGRVRVQPD